MTLVGVDTSELEHAGRMLQLVCRNAQQSPSSQSRSPRGSLEVFTLQPFAELRHRLGRHLALKLVKQRIPGWFGDSGQ